MIRKFLAATAAGFEIAARDPEAAAKVFLASAALEHSDHPLPEPLDERMVTASHTFTANHFLDATGRWGRQRLEVWDGFLDWLSGSGLLTAKVQSRGGGADVANTTTLDGLRGGEVGDAIPRESVKAADMFTNEFLP